MDRPIDPDEWWEADAFPDDLETAWETPELDAFLDDDPPPEPEPGDFGTP